MLIFYSALLYLFLLMRFVCSFIPCICPCQAFADFCKINQEAYSLSLYSQCTRYNPTAGASPFWSTNLCARHSAQGLTFTNTFNPHNHLTQHVQLWSQFSWWGNRGSARLRRGRAGIQVQTGWLQGAGMHLLHREAYLYVWCGMLAAHMALWLLPSGVPGASWIRSFSLHHQFFVFFFFNARGDRQGSIDEFSETAAVCLNKALFSIPRILAHRPSSQPVPPGASFPVVPACLYSGSCRAGSNCILEFSSLELICPQVNSK